MQWKTGALLLTSFVVFLVVIAATLTNMNGINLLIAGTSYGTETGGQASQMENFDVTEEAKEQGYSEEDTYDRNGTTMSEGYWKEIITNGSVIGSSASAGTLNLLWLLQNAGEVDKSSYAYQLLEIYGNVETGRYRDAEYHGKGTVIMASHYNETRLASFADPGVTGFGKGSSRSVLNANLRLEDVTKVNAVKRGSGGVFVDRGRDGVPDGPLQNEKVPKNGAYADKRRGDKTFDIYSLVDSINAAEATMGSVIETITKKGANLTTREMAMIYGLIHNRGEAGMIWVLHGLPYTTSSSLRPGNYLNNSSSLASLSKEQIEKMVMYPRNLYKWFNSSNIPLEIIAKDTKASGMLLALKNGAFLDTPLQPQTKRHLANLGDDVGKFFPGQTKNTIVQYIDNNFVKKPWTAMGMSKSEFDKHYGSSIITNKYEEVYRRASLSLNTVFYFDTSVTSDNYKAGSDTVVLAAIEGLAHAYMMDVSVLDEYIALKVAIEAGIKSLNDSTIVDPSNPSNFYKTNGTANASSPNVTYVWVPYETAKNGNPSEIKQTEVTQSSISYDPSDLSLDANFSEFLKELNLYGKLTKAQLGQISTLYKYAGGQYSQPKRGQKMPDGIHYYTDCSLYTSWGLHMGKGSFATTATFKSNHFIDSVKKTHPYQGTVYKAKVVQLNKDGTSRGVGDRNDNSISRKDMEWLEYLKTGDIANGRTGAGHVWTYLGKNTTSETFVLPVEISRASPQWSTYKPGEHFSMESSGGAIRYGGNKMGLHPKSPKRSYDSSGRQYQAYRPVYNPQY